jgi:hypothetical protein
VPYASPSRPRPTVTRRRSHADAAVVSQWLIDQFAASDRPPTSAALADRQRRLAPPPNPHPRPRA